MIVKRTVQKAVTVLLALAAAGTAVAQARRVDVWDFGGVAAQGVSTNIHDNNIAVNFFIFPFFITFSSFLH